MGFGDVINMDACDAGANIGDVALLLTLADVMGVAGSVGGCCEFKMADGERIVLFEDGREKNLLYSYY